MTSQDLSKGIDITGLEDVTGSEMNQLVDAGRLASDKGMRIVTQDTALDTPDVPNPNVLLEGVTPTFWKRYKWVRLHFLSGRVREYNWNDNLAAFDPTYLKWEESANVDDLELQIHEVDEIASGAFGLATEAITEATNAVNTANTALTNANQAITDAGNAQNDVDTLEVTVASLQTQIDGMSIPNLPLTIPQGGTGASTVDGAKTNLGLQRVVLGSFYVWETKNLGVSAGNSVDSVWTKRIFNSIALDNVLLTGFCTLNPDGSFNLSSGVWSFEIECPANQNQFHKCRLAKSDESIIYGYGTSEFADTTYAATKSKLITFVNLATLTELKVDHITSESRVDGFGSASSLGLLETYSTMKISYLGSI